MQRGYELGRYAEWSCATANPTGVDAFWTFAPAAPRADGLRIERHRVLPHAAVTVALETRHPFADPCHRLLLIGPASRHRFFVPPADARFVAVRLHVEWAWPLLGIDPGAWVDRIEPVPDEHRWRALRDGLASAASPAAALRGLARWVEDRHRGASPDRDQRIARALLTGIRSRPDGSVPLRESARHAGISERTLRRTVRRATGMAPKRIHRIERLNRTLRWAEAMPRPRWSALAYSCGYADQAHLVREVRALSGLTPTGLHAERRAQRTSSTAR